MSNQAHRHKYRPYLTQDEIQSCIIALKSESLPKTALIHYLEGIILGAQSPSLTLKPKILESLGLADSPSSFKADERLYNRWKLAPESCSAADLELVKEYRYTNSLMTPDEQEAYEQEQFQP